MFPGKKTFFIVLAVLIALNALVVLAGVPFAPLAIGAAFWMWVVWGVIGAIVGRGEDQRPRGLPDRSPTQSADDC